MPRPPFAAGGCNSYGALVSPVANRGNYTWTATANGSWWFKCDVGSHCTAGNMVLPVTVTGCPAAKKAAETVSAAFHQKP